MSTKAIQNTIIGLFFLTLIIPFIVFTNSYFPYVVGKAFVFRGIVSIMLILWALLCIKDSKFLPSKNSISLSVLALIVFYFISDALGPEFIESIFGNYERMMGWVSMVIFYLFFLVISSVIKEKGVWHWYFFGQIATSLVLFLFGLRELVNNGLNFRIEATLNNSIYLSILFLFSVFFALYLLFEDYPKLVKTLLVVSILINSLGILFSGSRGTMVGLFISVIIISICFIYKYWSIKSVRFTILSLLTLIVLVPILIFSFRNTSFIENNSNLKRLTEINITEGTFYARLMNWEIAWKGIKERPVLGWGQMNYDYVFDRYYNPELYKHESFFDSSHNTLLDVWVSGGILSLLSYLLIFVFSVFYLIKKVNLKDSQKFVLIGLLVAYFIQNLFVFDNITSFILFFIVLSFIVSSSSFDSLGGEWGKVLSPILIILTFSVFVFAVFMPWRSNSLMMQANLLFTQDRNGGVALAHDDGIAENLSFYRDSLKNNYTGLFEIKKSTVNMVKSVAMIESEDNKINFDKKNFIDFSVDLLVDEAERYPENAWKKVIAASAIAFTGSLETAENYLEDAVKISPNRQLYLFHLSEIKNSLGKKDEYLDIKEKIYNLDKSHTGAWLDYVIAVTKADQSRFKSLSEENISEDKIIKLEKYLESVIEKKPEQPVSYLNEVVIFANLGLFEKSIESLDIFEKKFPESVSQTRTWRSKLEKGEIPG